MLSKARNALRLGRSRWSYMRLSTRITLMFASILFVVLLAMSLVTGIGLSVTLYHQAEVEMEASIHNVLERVAAGQPLRRGFFRDDPLLPGVVLRVTDERGNIILENDAHYPSIDEVEQNLTRYKPLWADDMMDVAVLQNMSIYYAKLATERDGRIYYLHFMKTITAERQFLRQLQRFLLLTGLAGFLIALAVGYFMSSRILRPIRAMTQTAREIEVEDMGRRIEVPPASDELSELAETFNHMLDRLQAGFLQQQRFVSDASHELRTPVTVIKGYSDLLSRWGRQDESILDEAISAIRSETEDMQSLIEKLLFLARSDQKRQVLHKERLEMSELIADIVKKAKLVATSHEVTLTRNDPAEIYADPVVIRQMIRIFLDNSMKYTPPGGRITVTSERLGKFLFVTLADTGVGIAKEDQEKVFERFYRSDSSRTKTENGVSGTGLGLPIARLIAKAHDIELTLTSEVGKGTTIYLKIPVLV